MRRHEPRARFFHIIHRLAGLWLSWHLTPAGKVLCREFNLPLVTGSVQVCQRPWVFWRHYLNFAHLRTRGEGDEGSIHDAVSVHCGILDSELKLSDTVHTEGYQSKHRSLNVSDDVNLEITTARCSLYLVDGQYHTLLVYFSTLLKAFRPRIVSRPIATRLGRLPMPRDHLLHS